MAKYFSHMLIAINYYAQYCYVEIHFHLILTIKYSLYYPAVKGNKMKARYGLALAHLSPTNFFHPKLNFKDRGSHTQRISNGELSEDTQPSKNGQFMMILEKQFK